MRKWIVILGGVAVISVAHANGLDATFGTHGKVMLSVGTDAEAKSAILQTDGKIVLIGTSPAVDRVVDTTGFYDIPNPLRDLLVARFNADGTLDDTFGGDGVVQLDFGGDDDRGVSLVQQADGKLLLLGETRTEVGDFDLAVARLNTDGTLDSSFNGTGKRTINTRYIHSSLLFVYTADPGDNHALKLLASPDGKILVAGQTCSPLEYCGSHRCLTLLRLLADGSTDAGYGPDGTGMVELETGRLLDAALRSDGGILVTGEDQVWTIDTTGMVFQTWLMSPANAWLGVVAAAASPLTGGAFYLAGQAYSPSLGGSPSLEWTSFVGRLDSSLLFDASFGSGGAVLGSMGPFSSGATSLLQEPSGALLASGFAARDATTESVQDGTIVRLRSDGLTDSSFGTAGLMTIDMNEGSTDHSFRSVALLRSPDGKLIMVGNRMDLSSYQGTRIPIEGSQRVALVRLTSTPQFAVTQTAITVSEGQTSVSVEVTRTGITQDPVSVSYSTSAGTAVDASDFTSTSGALTWNPTDADQKTIVIPLSADSTVESAEQFTFSLSNPSEGSIDNGALAITIADDDVSGGSSGGGGGGALGWLTVLVLTSTLGVRNFPGAGRRRISSIAFELS